MMVVVIVVVVVIVGVVVIVVVIVVVVVVQHDDATVHLNRNCALAVQGPEPLSELSTCPIYLA